MNIPFMYKYKPTIFADFELDRDIVDILNRRIFKGEITVENDRIIAIEEKAHDYIAKIMADNYNNQTQIEVNEKNYDRIHNVVVLDDIFDYTNGSLAD